jgi:drug/metabolite transporter (DMT)-like permease
VLGIGLMIVAAFLQASASVLQRRSARTEPDSAEFSLRLIADLARRPGWLLGIAAMISGFLLHAASISLSRIALVQPILVAELPFTLVLAAWTFRLPLSGRDWLAVGMATAGLAAFLGCLAPTGGDPGQVAGSTWALGAAITVVAVGALVLLGYRARREHGAALLGIATGAAFGLNSALIAGAGASVKHGHHLLASWQTYAIAALAPAAFFLLQNALEKGNLVATQPGLTLTNPLVSVAWGLVVFGEHGRGGPFLLGTAAGAALIAAGTITLSRSRLLDPDATRRATQRDGEHDDAEHEDAEHEDAERKDAEQNKEARPQPDDTSQAPSRGRR